MRLLDDVVALAARDEPDVTALVFGDERTTFAQLDARVGHLATALARWASPGDRVAVVAGNDPAWVDCYYGVPRAGLVLALLNHRLGTGQLRASIDRARPSVLVIGQAELEALRAHGWGDGLAPVVVVLGRSTGAIPYTDLIAGAPAPTGDGAVGGRRASDTAWLLPTSGTSGTPKWVELSHANLAAAVAGTAAVRPLRDTDSYLSPFPLCHVAGYNVVLFHAHRLPVVLLARFDPADFTRHVAVHRASVASLAPTMLHDLLDHLDRTGEAVDPLRAITYGASPISPSLLARALATLDVDLHQGYGMTELAGNAVFLGPDDHRRALADAPHLLRAAGRPGPEVAIRLLDDDGAAVAAGEDGEIGVRAPQVMKGYWEAPAANAEAFTDDGWFRTGDIGRWDDEGYLYIVDRKKDVIVSGGENVSSRLVEDHLATHPAVADVAVVGVPDDRWGEVVCAVVVPRPGSGLDEAGVLAHGRAAIGGYQQPRRVVLVDQLPRNASGKVLKAELRARIAGAGGDG